MVFQAYTPPARTTKSIPAVTINPQGRFSINKGCLEQYPLFQTANCIVLLYDKETNKVGIRPVDKDQIDKKYFNIKLSTIRDDNKQIINRNFVDNIFLNSCDIKLKKTTRFNVTWNDDIKAITFKVDNGRIISRKKAKYEKNKKINK